MIFIVLSLIIYVNACSFSNSDFTQPLNVGWTISNSNPTPYIDTNDHYLILGDITNQNSGNSSVYQDFSLTSCAQNITIMYSPYTKDFNYIHDRQMIEIKNPSNGNVVATLLNTLLGFNFNFAQQWYNINCNVCTQCGGVNLTELGISPLRLELKVLQNVNTKPTALIVKSVC
jgi:hypothetical protein